MTTPDLNQRTTGVIATTMPSVNLLPAEIAEAARFRRLQFAMGAAVVGAVVVVGALYVHNKSAVTDANAQVTAAQQAQTAAQQELTSLSNVSAVYAQVAAKQAMVTQAMGQEVDWSTYMSDLSLRIPDNVWLSSVQVTQSQTGLSSSVSAVPSSTPTGIGNITFSGVAFSHDDVATWLDMLAKEKGFANAYFTNATKTSVGRKSLVNFTSSVDVTGVAESNRYTKPAGN